MAKTINAKIFALKHKLWSVLDKSLKADKNAIKEGAKITFNDYCKINVAECTKATLDKDKVQILCDKYNIDITTLEKTTKYLKIDVSNVPTEVDTKVNEMLATLENSNDNITKRAASSVANIK